MQTFEYFLESNLARVGAPDKERAKSLINDGKGRIESIETLDINKYPKIIFENIYDALRDFCDALLINDDFRSYSHEASISYLFKKGFDVTVVNRLDRFRYKRNSSKYYGEQVSIDEAKQIKDFYLEIKELCVFIQLFSNNDINFLS